MKDPKSNKLRKRIFNLWFTSLLSITLVLLMIGILGLVLINAKKLSDYVREKIGFTLVLEDNIKAIEIINLQNQLKSNPGVKSIRYIDKETAAKELADQLGEDFSGFLGYNPLFASIEVKLFARSTHPDSIQNFENRFMLYPNVKEVYFQKSLAEAVNQNVRRISVILLIISLLLTFIFVVLINNTIRISVYSQRFTINTMQMVGATNSFIRKPFLWRSFKFGIYGSLLSNTILFGVIYSYKNELEGIISVSDYLNLGIVFSLVIILGIVFSLASTYVAVNKFLNMKFDEMFY
ncbi:MAG: cell division protein FtsX [Prolixibacteraceae bacterium]|nr:cell division protein FtsX [Prolixibacteraceae bacterium]